MNQDQQPRPWWKDNWPVLALLATVIVIVATGILGYWQSWQRPFWDWLDLLIIPLVLALGAFWFNTQTRKSEQELAQRERENDLEIAADRARDDALQRYLDRMSELVLDKNLKDSDVGAAVWDMARARTLTVLRSLEGEPKGRKNRKGQVVSFLYQSDLIGRVDENRHRTKAFIDLDRAFLHGADLSDTFLHGADLSGSFLVEADLVVADLSAADLSHADLSGANLNSADLSDANLNGAFLNGASLGSADLSGADLTYAEFLTDKQLAQAESLVGATLPDGRVIETEEDWEEFKKRYGQ